MDDTPPTSPPPPDSWPGAEGRRSEAPEVAPWPGGSRRQEARPTVDTSTSTEPPGGSWPGAASSDRASEGSPGALPENADLTTQPHVPPAEADGGTPGGVAGVLFPAITVLVTLGLVGIWIVLDEAHRSAQRVTLIVVAAVALAALAVSAYRHRTRG